MSRLEQFRQEVKTVKDEAKLSCHQSARLVRLVRNVEERIRKPTDQRGANLHYNLVALSELLQQTHPTT
ncbi:MAG TPA: hypothetical protein PLE99_00770 [Candidatus Thiothrix moscowensis]|uniref:hypothetical protein n=1 Tax=unclassified Thiothrix TaxID=2636184 RepID=UPI0025CE458D|nr:MULTISPECIES: hypothetical protein [unclassified Thiothrix]HRJ51268.1 hypothetical protein [Candidatus Thiothrix moscowensis]HRJ91677.1 hypothetical protein [Candidatus Thiothrix moscowensis]